MPDNLTVSSDGKMLILKQREADDFYNNKQIKTIELEFEQQDWKQQLANNYNSKKEIAATLYFNGKTYENVGVRYRGQTSYMRLGNSDKKSFNISLDFIDEDQRIDDYKTLNLLNCYDDPSFIKEALFTAITGQTIPAALSNYVKLIINGESWGLYFNIQQLNSSFYDDWFTDGDGINWRADYPDTSTARLPGDKGFGAGFCSLNYLSTDPVVYQRYYTLKSSSSDEPWYHLMKSCEKLNTLPVNLLYDSLKNYLDVDRALWHIANEIILADDDGYINKGGMDYYVFYDLETGRINPIEYDGNSTFVRFRTQNPIFFKESDNKLPLINRLLQNAELKQRYIAHVRAITNSYLDTSFSLKKLRYFKELTEAEVLLDNKKIYSNAKYYQELTNISSFIIERLNYLRQQVYFKDEIPVIENVGEQQTSLSNPNDRSVTIKVKATHSLGLSKVVLYHGGGLQGVFEKVNMQRDTEAGNDVYSARIPEYPAGSYVRYYIEAIANDNVKTASYLPEGAEHDVFFYQVEADIAANSDVVINEMMAKNTATITDPQGEYDDWIELFNKGNSDINLGGKYLTDKVDNLKKWQFPENTMIRAGGYLLLWADENGKATPGIHTNFKLSGSGESIILVDSDANGNSILDSVNFGPQEDDISYGRLPNGTGDFQFLDPTPNGTNQKSTGIDEMINSGTDVVVFPNPFTQNINISISSDSPSLNIQIFNQLGETVKTFDIDNTYKVSQTLIWNGRDSNNHAVSKGVYYVKLWDKDKLIVKQIILVGN